MHNSSNLNYEKVYIIYNNIDLMINYPSLFILAFWYNIENESNKIIIFFGVKTSMFFSYYKNISLGS